jgi:hypothetical protein
MRRRVMCVFMVLLAVLIFSTAMFAQRGGPAANAAPAANGAFDPKDLSGFWATGGGTNGAMGRNGQPCASDDALGASNL